MEDTKIILQEKEMPTSWYNIQPDLSKPLEPILHPGTKEATILPPPLFAEELNNQEFSKESFIEIPEEIQEMYKLYRPTPLYRARRLEKELDTPAKIYYKYEGVSPPGSHKPNTAIAQAYYAKKQGIERLATETGAGQWGSALALACSLFGLELKVYMVKASYHQKPYRRVLMETWGAEIVPSPSQDTQAGKKILEDDPDCPGSLGIAISEAVEDAATHDNTLYSLGSVLNHVLMHQTIIGLECQKQLEMVDDYPDLVIGCIGGGSSLGGIALPYIKDKMDGKNVRILAVEPTACPTLTKGTYAYDFGDTAMMAPIAKMYTLGHTFIPDPIHAGGLRYHGDAPLICALYDEGLIEAIAYHQNPVFDSAVQFAKTEGIIAAPETAHGIKAAVDEALMCKESGESKTILINLTGHGHFDLAAYDAYHSGELEDYEYPDEKIKEALTHLPQI